MLAVLFFVCLVASTIGAIVGAGGGVIIKPVLDAFGVLPVSTVSFLSSVTVLCMSVSSLIRTRNNGVKLSYAVSTPLAIGAVIGGVLGKALFECIRTSFGVEGPLGLVQSICLIAVTTLVLIYTCHKHRLPSYHVHSAISCAAIGLALGLLSSFLGVGGGPYNVTALFLFFTMEAKQAAKNSIYIIVFSQTFSILTAIISGTVPAFTWPELIAMALGGVGGAIAGAAVSARMHSAGVENALKLLCAAIILISIFNAVSFAR